MSSKTVGAGITRFHFEKLLHNVNGRRHLVRLCTENIDVLEDFSASGCQLSLAK